MKYFFRIYWTVLILLFLSGCATFEGNIPLESDEKEIYLSPKNADGIMDTLSLPLSVPEIKGLKVQGYSIEIKNGQDTVVYSKSERKEPKGFFKRKTSVLLPGEVLWDGKTLSGDWASDGFYSLTIQVYDYKGNTGDFGPVQVIVDNTPPYAELFFPYSIFSPNEDGSQDTLDIYQINSSSEALWTGTLSDSDKKSIRTYKWKGLAPNFVWDGKSDSGQMMPEGKYSYTLNSTDEAGNTFTMGYDNINIDNSIYPVSISLLNSAEFSPNDDGIQDSIQIQVDAPEKSKIRSIKMEIINAASEAVIELDESSDGLYVFDGKKSGKRLPEGYYYANLEIQYNNGDIQKQISERIKLDITPPSAVVKIALPVFSPNGDGRKDVMDIYQSSSIEPLWTGRIIQDEKVIRAWSWNNRVLPVQWDGKNAADILVADGNYRYQLQATDNAGNSTVILSPLFSLDTRPTPVKLTQSANIISPNSDGDSDYVQFYPLPEVKEGIASWSFTVKNEGLETVFTVSEANPLFPESISWDGKDLDGKVTEGIYNGFFEIEYHKGNTELVGSVPSVVIDITAPEIAISTSMLPFSPDGDGDNDTLKISILPEDSSGIKQWSARILDPKGIPFLVLNPADFKNGTFQWNGKDKKGELVQSASDYKLEVMAEDMVGNKSTVEKKIPIDILVIKDGDKLRINVSSIIFKPFTADYLSVEPDQKASNLKTLNRLSEILKKYSQYNIQLEGHAVRVLWYDTAKWLTEENEVLMPLSQSRADTIMNALVQRGIKTERMTTKGYGGYKPVVPHSDELNRWKNRRVEFILVK